jgi:hypothetical protein
MPTHNCALKPIDQMSQVQARVDIRVINDTMTLIEYPSYPQCMGIIA